jgi:FkbM family methyltransferase
VKNVRLTTPRKASDRIGPQNGLVTASALKIKIAGIVTSARAGNVIGTVTRRRIRHMGVQFDTRSPDFSPQIRARMFWGMYESAETKFIKSHLRDSETVVELGSSLGITSAHIATTMNPRGHLVCVEANPQLVPGLRQRIMEHAESLQVEVIHAAVTSHCGTTALALAPETMSSHLAVAEPPRELVVYVPALTLRDILRQTHVTEFDLVSDIEGGEAAFLLQDPSSLDGCRNAVIELHEIITAEAKVSVFDLIDAATTAGFQVASRHGPVVALKRP